ncbi:ABC transporter substrate-binding protein [Neoroseomonas soli]|uniref:ABC transporter substrate-binding protein n=1 Tax=Neoroseomonas soli TaxID=1081025 RepID=A0A9X9WYM9_9PROT|nr:ABC transporter substrate-binding protein [Neoroseomonas soli]MBR0672258.1 ABC transporter substrate-binding protein [Neoroseomonas soli]
MRTARWTAAIALAGMLGVDAAPAAAQGTLNLYCSVQIEWCQAIANNFQRDSGIRVNMTQRGSGETLAAIRAEGQNPRGDVWFGGTGDPHLAAGEENLTQAYESPNRTQLHDWALRQWEQSGRRAVGVYAGAVGFGYNTELLARKGIEPPRCWADLVQPRFRGEIQVANPNSSGTAYVIIATLVQLMGEDQAFAYMRQLHPNINSYARSGTGPIKAVARGETGVSLSFVHDAVTERNAGFPVAYTTPCEGTGYEIGSMSIIRGARNVNQARRFYDWALTEPAQRLGFEAGGQLQTPANRSAPLPPNAPDLSQIRLIEYDFAKYGRAAERRRLIERWDREVGSLPR